MERFFEGDHDVRFDIAPAFGCRRTSAEPAESRSASAAAEKRLEEIAKPGSAKFKFDPPIGASVLIKSAARLLCAPSRRRLKSAWLIPIRAKLIVFLSFFRVAQDLIRLIDLLELFLGSRFVLRDIGMMLPGQLAKGTANFLFARCLRHAQRFVIISKLHRHRPESLARLARRNYPLPF